jgi:hypothetical protein
MKWSVVLFLALAVVATPSGRALAHPSEVRGFGKLKSLVGEWEGKNEKGEAIHATFKLIASDSALLEIDTFADESTTVTVYHADMDHVALTYYSKANNQPRLSADPSVGDPKQLDFSFAGATNLHNTQIAHVHHLLLRFEGNDHLTAVWTWLHNDQEQVETYHFTRSK